MPRKRPKHAPSIAVHKPIGGAVPRGSHIRPQAAAVLWALLLWFSLVLIFAWEPPWLAVTIGSVAAAGLLVALAVERRATQRRSHRPRVGETLHETAETPKAA